MDIAIICVPYDLDVADHGMGAAPNALLEAGVAELLGRIGGGAVLVQQIEIDADDAPRLARIGRVMQALGQAVAEARDDGFFPLILGGDCLTVIGVLAGLGEPDHTGVAWIDAHGDFNTPEISTTGYLGGMPLACAAGRGLDELRQAAGLVPIREANIALIGPRDLDPAEEAALVASAVRLLRPLEIPHSAALNVAIAHLATLEQVDLHLDIDILDPSVAPGWNYQVPGGLLLDDVRMLVGRLARLDNLAAVTLTALNPERDDRDGSATRAAMMILATIFEQLVLEEV